MGLSQVCHKFVLWTFVAVVFFFFSPQQNTSKISTWLYCMLIIGTVISLRLFISLLKYMLTPNRHYTSDNNGKKVDMYWQQMLFVAASRHFYFCRFSVCVLSSWLQWTCTTVRSLSSSSFWHHHRPRRYYNINIPHMVNTWMGNMTWRDSIASSSSVLWPHPQPQNLSVSCFGLLPGSFTFSVLLLTGSPGHF